jgi:hypothetical protein
LITLAAISLSEAESFSSIIEYIRSNLDNKVSGNAIFLQAGRLVSYTPYIGLAAATTEHLAFKLT